ncbi:DUF6924 domain-containing protein [Actinoplanes sp. NPDC048796]|uniref:DUF6924 domain-containing protein n=1 Tax=Actinoplanes sp. NPDC048796 TaxID=3155640 RepID=UPI0033C4FCA8
MSAFPPAVNEAIERYASVVVRTDYSDDEGWLAVLGELAKAPEDWDGEDPENFIVDDPSWSGAGPDEIRDVVRSDEYLSQYLGVVVIADTEAVTGDEHLLLVVATTGPGGETFGYGREFRSAPREAYQVSVNVGLGNMSFAEFAETAAGSPDGVFRGFPD